MSQVKSNSRLYSYHDYLNWPDDERWEIMDGIAYNMSPAPSVKHQSIVSKLDRGLGNKVEEKGCSLFIAPTDVVFDEYNVVQPDVFVVCDKAKITDDNIQGAPDLVIEVISPSTSLKDKREKKKLYEKFGVKEYLIIYPEDELVERFILQNDKYPAPDVFNWDETMMLGSLALDVNLWEIFGKEREEKEEVQEDVR
jgi:Uma2 family endonuclease